MSSALARTQGGTGVCTQPVLGIPGLIVFSRPRSGLGVNLISTSCQPTWMSFRALLDPRVLDRSAPFHGWCRWPCRMGRYGRINYSAWDIARPYKTRPQRLRTEHDNSYSAWISQECDLFRPPSSLQRCHISAP